VKRASWNLSCETNERLEHDVNVAKDWDEEGVMDADAVGDDALHSGMSAPPTMAATAESAVARSHF
jgi:hypothetical protein